MNPLQVRCILAMSEDGIADEYWAIVVTSFEPEEQARLMVLANATMLD